MKNSDIKIIFVDIDNTVLWHHNQKHDFDKKSLKALRKAQEKYGVKVAIATARPYDSALTTGIFNYIKPDAVVGCNGTNAIVENRVVYSDAFPKEIVNNVVDVCSSLGIVVEISTPFHRYFSMAPNNYVDYYFQVYHETIPEQKIGFDDEDVNAMLLFMPEECEKAVYEKLDKRITGFRFTNYGVDMHIHEVSKADGVKAILEYFGIAKDNAMSIGDSFSGDGPMFECTKYSVAMGNSRDELKQKAYFVTKHIKKHGLKYALKTLKII